MIRNKPILFISDLLDPAVESTALFYRSFESICEEPTLAGFDHQRIDGIGQQLTEAENRLYIEYPGIELTCVHTQKGAYWLNGESLKIALQNLTQQMQRTEKSEGRMPIWKLTVEELLSNHLDNLKHLVQIYAHDSLHLERLKIGMNGQQDAFTRLFEDCWRTIRRLVERVERWSLNRDGFFHPYFILLDRCRITKTMLNRREIDESILGYSVQDLVNVEKNLEERCRQIDPDFHTHQDTHYRDLLTDLLEGERIQRLRVRLWQDLFQSLKGAPEGFHGMAQLMEWEQIGLDSFISVRLDELQADNACQAVYDSLRDHPDYRIEPLEVYREAGLPLTDEEIRQLLVPASESASESGGEIPFSQNETKRKARTTGMAFQNRRR